MKKVIVHEPYGEILCEENNWTGRKSVSIGGKPLETVAKNTFRYSEGESAVEVKTKGSFVTGLKLAIGEETLQVFPSPKWYEILLALPCLLFILIWGNSLTLVSIFPVVGGALGGGISGGMTFLSFYCMRVMPRIRDKILVGFAFLALTVFVCWLLAIAIIG